MSEFKALYKAFGIDAIYGIDAETFWASDYSLSDKKRGTTDYVIDERFELQLMSVQKDTWGKPKVMTGKEFKRWAATINWPRIGVLGHHEQFDGLIKSHHCGIKKIGAHFDTLSMARPLLPVTVGGSLKAVCGAFGREAKKHADALANTKGLRWAQMAKPQQEYLKLYGGEDIEDTWFAFRKLLPFFTIDELRLIDITIKMYVQPTLLVDKDAVEEVLYKEIERKQALVMGLGLHKKRKPVKPGTADAMVSDYDWAKKLLSSKPKFAELLKAQGIAPPTKVSAKQSEKASEEAGYEVEVEVLAMSKQDQEFKDLLAHPKKKVRELVEARFAVTSNILENRCTLLARRAGILKGPQPVYLNYYGAKTGRWSGGDNANWQNLSSKRKEGGAELRASVHAPPGHMLVIADLAQIEARINAWFSGEHKKVQAFRDYDTIIGWTTNKKGEPEPIRAGPDGYRLTAANVIYMKPVEEITDPERFMGKTTDLALGFQAGAKKFAGMCRIGQFGPPMEITDSLAADIHKAWRDGHPAIVGNWKRTNQLMKQAFFSRTRIEDGVVAYEGVFNKKNNTLTGWMHLPNGMAIRYDDVRASENGKDYSYISEYRRNKVKPPTIKRTKMYGGLAVENRTQALARVVIGEQMLAIMAKLKNKARIAMSTHDEIVLVVPTRMAKKALAVCNEIMSKPPAWAPDLPIAADTHISARYDK